MMPLVVLLRSQKNEVFNLIRGSGFDPSEFEWDEEGEDLEIGKRILRHTRSGYYYVFDINSMGKRFATFSPGDESTQESSGWFDHWGKHAQYITKWLTNLRHQVEAPDLWAALSQEKRLAETASKPDLSNSPFTSEEQKYVATQLNEIKEFLFHAQDFSEQHRQFVTSRLNYLADAAARQGRVDWLNIAVGTLFGIVTQTAISSELARELFRFAGNALSQLFGGTPMLPH